LKTVQELTSVDFREESPASLRGFNQTPPLNSGMALDSSTSTTEDSISAAEKLLELQDHLRNLVSADAPQVSNKSVPWDQNGYFCYLTVDEALSITKTLLEITHVFLGLGGGSPTGVSSLLSRDHSMTPPENFTGPAFRSTSTTASHVTIFQILTCYAYLLQVLEPVISRLASQAQTPPIGSERIQREVLDKPRNERQAQAQLPTPSVISSSTSNASSTTTATHTTSADIPASFHLGTGPSFSLGCFSLASQPTLNADLVLHTFLRMIQRTHTNINLLAFGCETPGQQGETVTRQPPSSEIIESADEPPSFIGASCSPVIMAAKAVMGAVHKKERQLVERLKELTNS
jgi:hypothetical protein